MIKANTKAFGLLLTLKALMAFLCLALGSYWLRQQQRWQHLQQWEQEQEWEHQLQEDSQQELQRERGILFRRWQGERQQEQNQKQRERKEEKMHIHEKGGILIYGCPWCPEQKERGRRGQTPGPMKRTGTWSRSLCENNSKDRSFKLRRTLDKEENSSNYSKEWSDNARPRERTPGGKTQKSYIYDVGDTFLELELFEIYRVKFPTMPVKMTKKSNSKN